MTTTSRRRGTEPQRSGRGASRQRTPALLGCLEERGPRCRALEPAILAPTTPRFPKKFAARPSSFTSALPPRSATRSGHPPSNRRSPLCSPEVVEARPSPSRPSSAAPHSASSASRRAYGKTRTTRPRTPVRSGTRSSKRCERTGRSARLSTPTQPSCESSRRVPAAYTATFVRRASSDLAEEASCGGLDENALRARALGSEAPLARNQEGQPSLPEGVVGSYFKLHEYFEAETRDAEWAPIAETQIKDYVSGRSLGDAFERPSIECRETLCEIRDIFRHHHAFRNIRSGSLVERLLLRPP